MGIKECRTDSAELAGSFYLLRLISRSSLTPSFSKFGPATGSLHGRRNQRGRRGCEKGEGRRERTPGIRTGLLALCPPISR